MEFAKNKLDHNLDNNLVYFRDYLPVPYIRQEAKTYEKLKSWDSDFWMTYVQISPMDDNFEHYPGWCAAIEIPPEPCWK